jgi:hypothetical protein
MFTPNTSDKLQNINVGNVQQILYIKNKNRSHLLVKASYDWLRQVGHNFDIYPWVMGGLHMTPYTNYSDILLKDPNSIEEFLRSTYIAIPFTNNKITSELYKHYYLEEIDSNQIPKGLSEASTLFNKVSEEKYSLRTSTPMLIGFIEAYLNTEKAGITDLKTYSHLLLYNYIEHITVFDQYMTYEQKGMEIVRDDLAFNSRATCRHISLQLTDDINLFLATEFSETSLKHFTIKDNKGEIYILNNPMLLESLKFLNENQKSLASVMLQMDTNIDSSPRGTMTVKKSMAACTQKLHNLKEILLRRDG